jgi:hypothetical protein
MTPEENKPFVPSEEVLKAAESALATIQLRPSGQRHPFGKMINCKVCGERHREVGQTTYGIKKGTIEQITTKCVQKFTNRIGDYELLKEQEDAEGNITLVPDYRTAATEGMRPTIAQIMGRKVVAGKRIKVHPSKMKLLFIEKTREAFADLGFDIEESDKEQHSKNLQAARELAAKRIRAAHKAAKTVRRAHTQHSRRINAGLENNGTRWYSRDRTKNLNHYMVPEQMA